MSTLEVPGVAVPQAAAPPPAADAPPLPFLEALPPELAATTLPLLYRLATPMAWEGERPPQRVAELPQNTSVLLCTPFYKAISRCVGGRS